MNSFVIIISKNDNKSAKKSIFFKKKKRKSQIFKKFYLFFFFKNDLNEICYQLFSYYLYMGHVSQLEKHSKQDNKNINKLCTII